MLKNITKSNQSTSSEQENPLQETSKPRFQGAFICGQIWRATGLNCRQKFLWVLIHALNGDAGCFASNEYLAREMQINEAS
jgi:hypothetical protein